MIYKISKNYKNSHFVFYNRLKKYSCSGKQGQSEKLSSNFYTFGFHIILYCDYKQISIHICAASKNTNGKATFFSPELGGGKKDGYRNSFLIWTKIGTSVSIAVGCCSGGQLAMT